MTALVLATYGDVCHLKLPGCTKRATTKDHVVPFSHGGAHTLENYRPACKTCNSRRADKVISGYGTRVVVVMGPPAAGKNTYVTEHASPADIVIDLDALARALMPHPPEQSHTYPNHVRDIAIAARKGALDRARRRTMGCTLWIIHAIPSAEQLAEYRALHYKIITIDPGRDIVERRARAERPAFMLPAVAKWYGSPWATATDRAPRELVTTTTEKDW
jgi:hypothetical protein